MMSKVFTAKDNSSKPIIAYFLPTSAPSFASLYVKKYE